MTSIFLTTHIIGAVVTGATILYAIIALGTKSAVGNKRAFHALSIVSVFQIITGILLSIVSGEAALAFCSKAALYLAVIITTQLALLYRNNISVHSLVPVHGINVAMMGLFVVFFG